MEQEYDDNFIGVSEYEMSEFERITEENIYSMLDRYVNELQIKDI